MLCLKQDEENMRSQIWTDLGMTSCSADLCMEAHYRSRALDCTTWVGVVVQLSKHSKNTNLLGQFIGLPQASY
jgi:hypothetical protein